MKTALTTLALVSAICAQTCQISLPLTLLDGSGAAMQSFGPADLQVKQPRGAAIATLVPSRPHQVELLIDHSGSMTVEKVWPLSEDLAEALLAASPPTTAIELAAFTDEAKLLAPFRAPASSYEALLARAYQATQPRGGTALYDAMAAGTAPRAGLRAGDAILVISDGEDDSSHLNASQATRMLQAAGVRLMLLHIGADSTPRDAQNMIRDSGGTVLNADQPKDADGLARTVWATLQDQAMVTVTLPTGSRGELRLAPAPALRHARVLAARPSTACQR